MAKDAYYFPHDSNARHDPKIRALTRQYGVEGYGRWWVVIEMLREAEEYKLDRAFYTWSAMADDMRCEPDEAEAFVNTLINDYKLLQCDETSFWSDSLCERMAVKDAKIEQGKKAAQARWEAERNADAMPTQCGSNADAMPTQCGSNANKNKKKKENSGEGKLEQGGEGKSGKPRKYGIKPYDHFNKWLPAAQLLHDRCVIVRNSISVHALYELMDDVYGGRGGKPEEMLAQVKKLIKYGVKQPKLFALFDHYPEFNRCDDGVPSARETRKRLDEEYELMKLYGKPEEYEKRKREIERRQREEPLYDD